MHEPHGERLHREPRSPRPGNEDPVRAEREVGQALGCLRRDRRQSAAKLFNDRRQSTN